MGKIPDFKTLNEAVDFWESHDFTDYLDDMEEVEFEFDLHQNLFHPKLVILTHRPDHCPRCRNDLDEIIIEYITWQEGHLLIIKDVPALRCRANKHEYITEKTLDQIEHLLEIEKSKKLQPTEIIQVPAFSLNSLAFK